MCRYLAERARDERDLEILRAVEAGETLRSIAARFDLFWNYPKVIYRRIMAELRASETPQ